MKSAFYWFGVAAAAFCTLPALPARLCYYNFAFLRVAIIGYALRQSISPEYYMSDVTIYHNPNCGTSRNALEMLRAAGIEPQVVEYLKNPPDRATLKQIISATGQPVRDIMRRRGTAYDEMDLDNAKWSDEQLIDLMLEQPVLINRPIVVTPRGARLCRPVELLQEILP
jgi:arsenate reductase